MCVGGGGGGGEGGEGGQGGREVAGREGIRVRPIVGEILFFSFFEYVPHTQVHHFYYVLTVVIYVYITLITLKKKKIFLSL